MDPFIQSLFIDVFKKMEIQPPEDMTEFRLMIDEQHPVLLRYDAQQEQVIILALLDIHDHNDKPALYQRLLEAGLNPLFGRGPSVGVDEKSGCCMSYFTFSRQVANAKLICQNIARLVEWNKQVTA